jgi:hypothetical protein
LTDTPLLNDHDGIGELVRWDRFEGPPEAVYGILLTIVSAAEEYNARPFRLSQSQESRIVQIGGDYDSLLTSSTLQDCIIRSAL